MYRLFFRFVVKDSIFKFNLIVPYKCFHSILIRLNAENCNVQVMGWSLMGKVLIEDKISCRNQIIHFANTTLAFT